MNWGIQLCKFSGAEAPRFVIFVFRETMFYNYVVSGNKCHENEKGR